MAGLDFAAVDAALSAVGKGEGVHQGAVTRLLQALVQSIKAANHFPTDESGDAILFANHATFTHDSEEQAKKLMVLLEELMEQVQEGAGRAAMAALNVDPSDPSTFEDMRDFLDKLMEGIDFQLDEAKGASADRQVQALLQRTTATSLGPAAGAAARPQDAFPPACTPDNSRRPFVPRLREKHNALARPPTLVPTGASSPPPLHLHLSAPHPYGPELAAYTAPSWLFAKVKEAPFVSPFTTPFAYVDTEAGLASMMEHLESPGVVEVAIDLEHHSMHSYLGLTCLIQISTRAHNFVVDSLALRQSLQVLNRVTTDPAVLKVLHGCRQDVLWLQRDFGVYLVGVFDTGAAAKELDSPALSLAYLMRTYAGVEASKQHQMADWRVRALPAELIAYARDDTHYLLGIADRLRNELLSAAPVSRPDGSVAPPTDRMARVIARSTQLCAAAYEKEQVGESYAKALARKVVGGGLPAPGMRVFSALAEWRDRVARLKDVSSHVVLPRRTLAKLARTPPTSVADLLRQCRPVPPSVAENQQLIMQMVGEAVQGMYEVPWNDTAMNAGAAHVADSLFDGTWTTWSSSVPLFPRSDASEDEKAVLSAGGVPVTASPGAALQAAAVAVPDAGPVHIPDSTPTAFTGGVSSAPAFPPAPAFTPTLQLHPSLGAVGVAQEPCMGFLQQRFVGIVGNIMVEGAHVPTPGASPWASAAVGVNADPSTPPCVPMVAVTSPASTPASITAAEVAAGLGGKYLHQLLPTIAPVIPDPVEALSLPPPPAATAPAPAAPAIPQSLSEVYDLSMRSRKRHKRKHGKTAPSTAPPIETGTGEEAGAVAAVEAGKPVQSDGAFLAALGWGDMNEAAAAAEAARVVPQVAKGSRGAARKMLASGKAAGAGQARAGLNAAGIQAAGSSVIAAAKGGNSSVGAIARSNANKGKRGKGKGKNRTVKGIVKDKASSRGGGPAQHSTAMGAWLKD